MTKYEKLACICLDNENFLSIFSQVEVYTNIYIQTSSSMQIIYTLLDSEAFVNFISQIFLVQHE